jgi:outer membrane immunogenic protein
MAIASIVSAVAADMPIKAPPKAIAGTNWSGWYVGISGGGDWGKFSQTNVLTGVSFGYFSQNGGLVGGTAGYNWQIANVVLGLETDLSWTKLYGTQQCGPGLVFVCSTETRAFGTFRGRAGVAVASNTLAFVTGGLAYGKIRATRDIGATTSEDWRAGWTVGGGIETMLMPQWSVKVEYLYASFPGTATTYTVLVGPTPVAATERDVQIVRAGLNWHF